MKRTFLALLLVVALTAPATAQTNSTPGNDTLQTQIDRLARMHNDIQAELGLVQGKIDTLQAELAQEETESTAKLVIEYIKALIWPLVLLVLLFLYRKYIFMLLGRIATAEEIDIFGVSAKLSRDISKFSDEIAQKANGDQLDVKEAIVGLAKLQYKTLATHYQNQPLQQRKQTATRLAELSTEFSLDDILAFANSRIVGERVGAGISLKVRLQNSTELAQDQSVQDTIADGLEDESSYVRYRFVRAIERSPTLVTKFRDKLALMKKRDPNASVREAVKDSLFL